MWGVRKLIEKTESHIIVRFLSLRLFCSFLLLGLLDSCGGRCCLDGECRWVSQVSLDLKKVGFKGCSEVNNLCMWHSCAETRSLRARKS